MNPAFGVLLIASVIAVNAFVIVDSYQTQMNTLDNQFNNQMNQTMGFLNNAWSIARVSKFKLHLQPISTWKLHSPRAYTCK